MTEIKEGVQAPEIDAKTDSGGTFSLADHAGKRVVLFFYPKADTPG